MEMRCYSSFNPPITGKVVKLEYLGSVGSVRFELAEVRLVDDHVFVEAGGQEKAKAHLRQIMRTELIEYLKLCDPYIGENTFRLLEDVPQHISIYILYQEGSRGVEDGKISEWTQELREKDRSIRVKTRKGLLHSRYTVTRGSCWLLGHSVHDAGAKDTDISKLTDPEAVRQHEAAFDRHWVGAD